MKRLKINLAMIAMLVAVTAAFAFKPAKTAISVSKTHHKDASYFFQFTGTAGNEANKALWQNVTSLPECDGINDGCLIEVPDTYTTASGSTRILTQNVPVVTSGTHKNPDTSSPMILAAANKNN